MHDCLGEKMRLIVVRHGRTEENQNEIVQGHLPGKISEEGIRQAKKVALRLKKFKIDAIFSSDLARTKATVKEILKFQKAKVRYWKLLRERNFGEFQGKSRQYLKDSEKESGVLYAHFKPKGGESLTELRERAAKALDKLYQRFPNKTVLIVTHGGLIRMILSIAMQRTIDEIEEAMRFKIHDTSVTIIEIHKGTHKLHLVNDAKHLL